MPEIPIAAASAPVHQNIRVKASEPLWQAAQALEQSFLSEMLGSAGFGAAREAFGGGAGEEQFSSFLRDAHAEAMVSRGGIGLAESIYRAMTEAGDGR